MRRTARLLAVVLLIGPISADAQFDTKHDPGFMLLAVPEDPHTYAAGAGPAGGFGIAAAADNPAAVAFGYRWQLQLPLSHRGTQNFRTASLHYSGASGLAGGISMTLIDPEYYLDGEYQFLTRVIMARSWDSTYSVGAAVSYVRSRHRDYYVQ